MKLSKIGFWHYRRKSADGLSKHGWTRTQSEKFVLFENLGHLYLMDPIGTHPKNATPNNPHLDPDRLSLCLTQCRIPSENPTTRPEPPKDVVENASNIASMNLVVVVVVVLLVVFDFITPVVQEQGWGKRFGTWLVQAACVVPFAPHNLHCVRMQVNCLLKAVWYTHAIYLCHKRAAKSHFHKNQNQHVWSIDYFDKHSHNQYNTSHYNPIISLNSM